MVAFFCVECGIELDCHDILNNIATWGVAKGVCTDCISVVDEREKAFKVQVKW